ncbi:YihY/virulence factor BrkB family protein [Spongisporangium articulatum]|uniref:YihY/virulence factor BrkB family protein n=1 Tax=Spongisporangium articulatum TaxID=3362603 RepID=A0ABW8AGS2_9ACTN
MSTLRDRLLHPKARREEARGEEARREEARREEARRDEARRDERVEPDSAPEVPTRLPARAWFGAVRRAVKEFSIDGLTDWAAALTYYGVLSIFPALLVLLSLIGLLGQDASQTLISNVNGLAPSSLRPVLVTGIQNLQDSSQSAGLLAIVGLLAALWSASGYISAFMRASNAIYDVPEGRPIWKTLPIRVGLTALIMVLLAACALAVVVTGSLAQRIGDLLGLGDAAVTAWNIAKWPVLLLVVSFMFALLYWASPNARQGFRWVSPGGVVGVLLWVVASIGFAVYVANFASYNKTYGSLAAVIVFLVWLWISNIALLLGAELNAELERGRAILRGHPADQEPYIELRDDSHVKESDGL